MKQSPQELRQNLAYYIISGGIAMDCASETKSLHSLSGQTFLFVNTTTAGLRTNEECVSWHHLADQANGLAAWLHQVGVRPGHIVGCVAIADDAQLERRRQALALIEAVLLPLAPTLTAAEQQHLLATTAAEWLWQPTGTLIRTAHRAAPLRWASPVQLALATSGSSDAPKVALISQPQLKHACCAVNARLDLQAGDCWLCCLPLQHVGGLAILCRCAEAKASVVVHPRFDAARVLADLTQHAVTHLSLVPPMLARLLDLDAPPPLALRVVVVGGQALDATLAQRALAAGWPITLSYGMTETFALLASQRLTDPTAPPRLQPLPEIALDCPTCPQPPATLRLRGALLMAGYAHPGRIPGAGLCDGWLTTDDLACQDSAQALMLAGRGDEQVVIAGINVQPSAIEARLRHAPGVVDCAVVALPEPIWGHRLVVFYVGTTTPARLDAWCRAHLPNSQRPRPCLQLTAMPVLASGKRDQRTLRELAAEA